MYNGESDERKILSNRVVNYRLMVSMLLCMVLLISCNSSNEKVRNLLCGDGQRYWIVYYQVSKNGHMVSNDSSSFLFNRDGYYHSYEIDPGGYFLDFSTNDSNNTWSLSNDSILSINWGLGIRMKIIEINNDMVSVMIGDSYSRMVRFVGAVKFKRSTNLSEKDIEFISRPIDGTLN